MPTSRRHPTIAAFCTLPMLALALAVVSPVSASESEPGVARVSVLRGSVDLKRADSGDTIAAAVNAPVSVGDYLSTLDDARAEVEFDYGAAVRIGAATQVRFTRLEPQHHELQLAQGTVELRVFRGLDAHAEIDTPQGTIRPDTSGRYRVSVADDGSTIVTVRSGRADVVTGNGTRTIEAGDAVLVSGDAESVQFRSTAYEPSDAFDRWNDQRDAYVNRTADHAYTDAGIVGADELDGYGTWADASYGRVWIPRQSPGWAPYNDGRWNWQPYYGWTWVGAEPWGWAPYHYGNWFYASGPGWCWYPGSFGHTFAYRPALVAFFSFGGLGFGFENIGWVPLAPFETFRPWYGRGFYNGATVVNNTTNVTNIYNTTINAANNSTSNHTFVIHDLRNVNAPGGAVAVNAGKFAAGDFRHVFNVTPTHIAAAAPVRGIVPVIPTRANLAVTAPDASAPHAHTIVVSHFTRFGEPAVTPRAFASQQSDVRALAHQSYPQAATPFEHQNVLLRTPRAHTATVATPPHVVHEPAAPKPTTPVREPVEVLRPPARESSHQIPTRSSPWDRFKNDAVAGAQRPPNVAQLRAARDSARIVRLDPFSRFRGNIPVLISTPGDTGRTLRSLHEPGEVRAVREPREVRAVREPGELRTLREPGESRTLHEPGELRTVREPRELRTVREPRELRALHEPRELRALREPSDVRAVREPSDVHAAHAGGISNDGATSIGTGVRFTPLGSPQMGGSETGRMSSRGH